MYTSDSSASINGLYRLYINIYILQTSIQHGANMLVSFSFIHREHLAPQQSAESLVAHTNSALFDFLHAKFDKYLWVMKQKCSLDPLSYAFMFGSCCLVGSYEIYQSVLHKFIFKYDHRQTLLHV